MKQILILFISLLSYIFTNAQQNFPSPSEDPFWTESHGSLWSCSYNGCDGYYCSCTMPVYYKTDTIINGTVYNRLYTRGVCYGIYTGGQPPQGCSFYFDYQNPESLFAIIRQDTLNKTVYLWNEEKDTLLYDFKNLIVGQAYPKTFNNPMQENLIVISKDSILIENIYVKKWNLAWKMDEIIYDSAVGYIIEGIGSSFGIIANLTPPFENGDELLCFSKNDVVLYPDSTYECDKTVRITEHIESQTFSIFPNPSTSSITVETDYVYTENCFLRVFTINGAEIINQKIEETTTEINVSSLAKGMYIIHLMNGKFVESRKFVKN